MRAPISLALLLLTPLACFKDTLGVGDDTLTAGETAETTLADSDTAATAAATGSDGSTSAAESTGATAPTSSTTADPSSSSTTDDLTTTGSDCPADAPCEPGAVEDLELCGACGVHRRSCGEACTWGAPACELDLDSCAGWYLPENGAAWKRLPVDPNAAFAPTQPVLAAIGLTPQRLIYALTADRYHIFATDTLTWIEAGQRAAIFPELAGQQLFHGDGIAAEPPHSIITLVAGQSAYSYLYLDGVFYFNEVNPCCGPDWQAPDAPPSPYAVRDLFLRIGNDQGWIEGNHAALCDLNNGESFLAYSLAIGDGAVYPQDIGYCFDFYAPIPFSQFAPFTYPGAPSNDLIGGAAWVDGLFIFRGE